MKTLFELKNTPESRNIILTGATGAVGSHILFELIQKYMQGIFKGNVILLSRGSTKYNMNAEERIRNILTNEYVPDYLKGYDIDRMMSFVEVIEAELTSDELSSKLDKVRLLPNCYLIHSAATTNLAKNEKAYNENYQINYLGTLNLFNATKSFIKKFTFISTAYSCGIQSGHISHNYKEVTKDKFRNHYEFLKSKIEIELENICEALNITFQILRPAVVCGRTMDAPLYTLANFHVFYGYAKFFHKIKAKSKDNPIHIKYQEDATLHVVPVDYVSKIIVAAFDDDSIGFLTIAPSHGMKVDEILKRTTIDVGYSNSHLTQELQSESSNMEALYYKTVHTVFGPYMESAPMIFDTMPLKEVLPEIPVPEIESHFKNLIEYAVNLDFQTLESVQFNQQKVIALSSKNLKKIG